MLTREQLENAAKCEKISCDNCNMLTDYAGYCAQAAAETALSYRDMLKQLEWREIPYIGTPCPICGNLKRMGHTDDCELKKLLGEE